MYRIEMMGIFLDPPNSRFQKTDITNETHSVKKVCAMLHRQIRADTNLVSSSCFSAFHLPHVSPHYNLTLIGKERFFHLFVCKNASKFRKTQQASKYQGRSPTTYHTGTVENPKGYSNSAKPKSASQTNRKCVAVLIYVTSEAGPYYLCKMATLQRKLFPQVSRGKEIDKQSSGKT